MRTFVTATAVALLALTASSATAADWKVTTPDLDVSINVTDVRFDGPAAVQVPVSITHAKLGTTPSLVNGSIKLSANQDGASNGISVNIWINSMWPASGTQIGGFLNVYPSSIRQERGPLVITGEVLSYVSAGSNEKRVQLAPTAIQLVYNATKLSKPRAKYVRSWESRYDITGMATATTLTKGVVPAGGSLVLQLKKPGRTQWVSTVSTTVDSYGEYTFSLRPAAKFPKGTQFRVSLRDCGWCTAATSPVGKL